MDIFGGQAECKEHGLKLKALSSKQVMSAIGTGWFHFSEALIPSIYNLPLFPSSTSKAMIGPMRSIKRKELHAERPI
jgi:hypothetical protein